jgi:hypothetical protein
MTAGISTVRVDLSHAEVNLQMTQLAPDLRGIIQEIAAEMGHSLTAEDLKKLVSTATQIALQRQLYRCRGLTTRTMIVRNAIRKAIEAHVNGQKRGDQSIV